MFRTFLSLTALGLLGVSLLAADPPVRPLLSVSRLANAFEVRQKLGLLADYTTVPGLKNVKVAILDSGFAGIDGKRAYLPSSAVLVEHYDRDLIRRFNLGDPEFTRPFAAGDAHGRAMAQLVWAVTGSHPEGPQFYLLNANGPTLFRRAVRFAIESKVDVILFSGTFEGAGNYDGRGPIDAAVDDALAAGILWVNAAGNSGGMVYNGPATIGTDGYVQFSGGTVLPAGAAVAVPAGSTVPPLNRSPSALRFTNRFDENTVTITLTWNDYRDVEDAGTDKDLDLIVEDSSGRVIGESTLTQMPAGKASGEGQTKNPRERVVLADLPARPDGKEYRIRVRAKGNATAFGPRDRIRVLVAATKSASFTDPDTGKTVLPVELLDATKGGEIYPPADHSGVLTVGDPSRFSSVGPTADGRVKPDVLLEPATARFSNGEESVGSSNAAAYFAGVLALMRAREPSLTTAHVREWVRRLDRVPTLPAPRVAVPPPAPPLSPNTQRALRLAEGSMDDNLRQKGLQPYVVLSGPNGTFVFQRGGGLLPGDAPPSTPRPPLVPAPRPPAVLVPVADRVLPHAAWLTPSSKALADLVRAP